MKARLASGATLAMQTGMFPDLLERPFELVDREYLRIAIKKEPVIRAGCGNKIRTSFGILSQELGGVGSNRNESGLEKL